MVPRFGLVLAVLTVVRAADITLVTLPAGNIKQGDKVDLVCTLSKGTKSVVDIVRFVREIDGVEHGMSTNAEVEEAFKKLMRYSIKYDDSAANGDIVITLTIDKIQGADGGHIGCFVYKGTEPKKDMTTLIVQVPVKDVTISMDGGAPIADGGDFLVTEGTPAKAVCVVNVDGSDLAPKTSLLLGGTDITSEGTKLEPKQTKASKDGLLALSYSETLEYTPKAADSGKAFVCKSETAEFPALSKSVTIRYQTALVFDCDEKVYAKVGSENVMVSCKVTGYPLPADSTWSWDHAGMAMSVKSSEAGGNAGYKAQLIKSDEKIAELKLTIPKVDATHFHTYSVAASNAVGTMTKTIELAEEVTGSAASTTTSTIKPTPEPTYVHVTEKPKGKEDPKEAASVKGGSGASSVHMFSATFASVLSIFVVCLI